MPVKKTFLDEMNYLNDLILSFLYAYFITAAFITELIILPRHLVVGETM